MEKAFCIGLRETRNKLVMDLNESGLPIDVMDMLVGELKVIIHEQAEREYQEALKAEKEKEEK